MSAIVSVDVIPRVSTGVLPPPAGGMVRASPRLAGSWIADDQDDHTGVAAGGVVLGALSSVQGLGVCHCTQEADLASAGALCARCGVLVGPYDRGGPLEAEEAEGLHRSHIPRNTETFWGPVLWPAQGSVFCKGSC